MSNWRETAEYVSDGDARIVGEDQDGYLWVPSKKRPEFWDRRFRPGNPTHWPYYVRSRVTNRIAFLETS